MRHVWTVCLGGVLAAGLTPAWAAPADDPVRSDRPAAAAPAADDRFPGDRPGAAGDRYGAYGDHPMGTHAHGRSRMAASDRYVYVLRGNRLYAYNTRSLQLVGSATLPGFHGSTVAGSRDETRGPGDARPGTAGTPDDRGAPGSTGRTGDSRDRLSAPGSDRGTAPGTDRSVTPGTDRSGARGSGGFAAPGSAPGTVRGSARPGTPGSAPGTAPGTDRGAGGRDGDLPRSGPPGTDPVRGDDRFDPGIPYGPDGAHGPRGRFDGGPRATIPGWHEDVQLIATDRAVYVLSGNQLWAFEAGSLRRIGNTTLPDDDSTRRAPGARTPDGSYRDGRDAPSGTGRDRSRTPGGAAPAPDSSGGRSTR
jgi:hypothetical protein